MKIKLSKYANDHGITYQTALNWFKDGKIANAFKSPSGSIFVDMYDEKEIENKYVVIYARVSNQSRRKELNYQVDRIIEFSNSRGYEISKTYKEVASGMNDSRKELWRMIEDKPSTIIIENKDRLTRFGFNYLEKLLKNQGTEIICMNDKSSDEDDLMKDMISIITSFCCRLYGLRRSKNKTNKIKEILDDNNI